MTLDTITLSHFLTARYTPAYWSLGSDERAAVNAQLLGRLRAATHTEVLQTHPTELSDILIWTSAPSAAPEAPALFFDALARATTPVRPYLEPVNTLWGFTRASQYSRARSPQDLDPFADAERRRYLVIYPFVKTTEWYLMSRDARQGMMNEHIRIGKQYDDIRQLLLYSSGVQDQEFVVVYEMDDLRRFSELVVELRATDARRYTLRDTPLHAAMYRPAGETFKVFE